MRLEHYSEQKLKEDIREIIARYLDSNLYKVFFFGSRVIGKGNERSDIDIGIEGPKKVPDVLMSKIQDDIDDLVILYKIDVVDFSDVSDDFHKVASEKREYLF